MTNIVSIDVDDREQVERLRDLVDRAWVEQSGSSRVLQRGKGVRGNALQEALRKFGGPKPEEVWTPGDIVQPPSGWYTAQRHEDGWHTTRQLTKEAWADDYQITAWTRLGRLRIIRQQSMEDSA